MANFVLCSERLKSVDALSDLAACATELASQGHTVNLVCNDLGLAHQCSELNDIPLFQTPEFITSKSGVRPSNVSSLLLTQGYDKPERLIPALRAWLHLLAALKAEYVIVDHAPTALLAAKLFMVSSVMIGTGFRVPPKSAVSPSFRPWRSATDKVAKDQADSAAGDQLLLSSVNTALKELGFEGLEISSPHKLYSHAKQWVMSVPEMDHYGRRDLPYVLRKPSSKGCPNAEWPDANGDKVFMILEPDSPHCKSLLMQLAVLDVSVLAVIPQASIQFIEEFQSDHIKIQTSKVNLRSVADQSKIIFSQADHDSCYELLMMGVPSILLPKNVQNTMLAYRLAKKRLGFPGPAKASKLDAGQLIDTVRKSDQVWHNASRFSLKYEDHKSLVYLHDLISDLCDKR